LAFLLAHLSDSHIGPLPRPRLLDLAGKRLTGYVNWKRRFHIHSMGVLGQILADIAGHKPDHTAMTGDILNIGLPEEFPVARKWLETLGPAQDVSFVPGNHDAYVRSAVTRIRETFAPWCSNDGEAHSSFPYLRVRGEVALIGLSSAIPTAPLLASGNIGPQQRAAFEKLLVQTAGQGLCRVVMIHHPPWVGGASFGRGLRDARQFEEIIARHGVELVIHGHNHRLMVKKLNGAEREAPVVGVASASAVPGSPRHRAAWHLYSIERAGNSWRIEGRVRGFGENSESISDIATLEL
jgi:3',5'-cyclic AMP phosphodiesterase CpdA